MEEFVWLFCKYSEVVCRSIASSHSADECNGFGGEQNRNVLVMTSRGDVI